MNTSFWIPNFRSAFYLCFLVCLFSASCSHYRYFPLSYHGVKTLDSTAVKMYLVDNEHVLTNVWAIKKYGFKKDEISCTIEKVPKKFATDIVQTISKEDIEVNKNQVLLFAQPSLTKKLPQSGSITFDYHELDRIQVVENDHEKTISYVILITLGLVATIGLLLLGVLFYAFLLFA